MRAESEANIRRQGWVGRQHMRLVWTSRQTATAPRRCPSKTTTSWGWPAGLSDQPVHIQYHPSILEIHTHAALRWDGMGWPTTGNSVCERLHWSTLSYQRTHPTLRGQWTSVSRHRKTVVQVINCTVTDLIWTLNSWSLSPPHTTVPLFLPGGASAHTHLMHNSLDPSHSPSQMAFRSRLPFLQNSRS